MRRDRVLGAIVIVIVILMVAAIVAVGGLGNVDGAV